MINFAQFVGCDKIYKIITPDRAANALEDLFNLHPDYVNWERAINKDMEDV